MYDEFLNFIFPLAKGAGEIQLAYFRGDDLGIETKSNASTTSLRAPTRRAKPTSCRRSSGAIPVTGYWAKKAA